MFTATASVRADASDRQGVNAAPSVADAPSISRRRIVLLLPVGIFAGMAVLLGSGLGRDPRLLPSALIGKSVPDFSLPPVQGRSLGLSSADLKGDVSLVNVFASWCVECRKEHPLFMQLKASGAVPLHGINYKDKPEDAAEWLDGMGDPYTRIGADLNGRVAIDWGVYGVPETFVIAKDGTIAYKRVGRVTPELLSETILPLVERLRR